MENSPAAQSRLSRLIRVAREARAIALWAGTQDYMGRFDFDAAVDALQPGDLDEHVIDDSPLEEFEAREGDDGNE